MSESRVPHHVVFSSDEPHPEVDQARHLLREGKIDQAVALLEPLTHEECDDYLLFEVLGIAYAYAGKLDASVGAFETAVSLNPISPQTHYNLGQAKLRAKDVQGARDSFHHALRVDATYARAREALVTLPGGDKPSNEPPAEPIVPLSP